MASENKDFSEYKATDRELYYAMRRGDVNITYAYFDNEVRFDSETKSMWLRVDCGKEDFAMADIMEESDEQHGHNNPDILSEETRREYEESDREIAERNAEWVKHFERKYNVDYEKQSYYYEAYSDSEGVPLPVNNVLCGCNINLNIGEGILDFIYADFMTPYKDGYFFALIPELLKQSSEEEKAAALKRIKKYEEEKGIVIDKGPYKVLSKADLLYEEYMGYKSAVSMAVEISYASLYSAICPPIFKEKHEYSAYKIYISYLTMLQKEFLELIEFCFDDEFYPEIFGKYQPHERFYVYASLVDRPINFYRDETFSTKVRPPYGALRKDNFDIDEVCRRLTTEIETTPELIALSEKYGIEIGKLRASIMVPKFVDKFYSFSTVSDILELEFTKMLEMDIRFRKCKRCGKYFIVKGNYGTQYCSRVEEGKTQSCQKLAALEEYKKKNANNEAKKIYDKYYKRYSARLKVNQIKEPQFNQWRYNAITKRDDCVAGKITAQEYVDWNESAFPNRTKRK